MSDAEFSKCPKCGAWVRGGLDACSCSACGYQKPYRYNRYAGRLFKEAVV